MHESLTNGNCVSQSQLHGNVYCLGNSAQTMFQRCTDNQTAAGKACWERESEGLSIWVESPFEGKKKKEKVFHMHAVKVCVSCIISAHTQWVDVPVPENRPLGAGSPMPSHKWLPTNHCTLHRLTISHVCNEWFGQKSLNVERFGQKPEKKKRNKTGRSNNLIGDN